jgi:hypothetical protein
MNNLRLEVEELKNSLFAKNVRDITTIFCGEYFFSKLKLGIHLKFLELK